MLIDLFIILAVIFTVIHNWRNGFSRQIFSAVGFFIGLVLGRALEPITISLVHTPLSRSLITIITIFGMAIAGLTAGEYIGLKLKYKWLNTKFNNLDNILGSFLTLIVVLLSSWLLASVALRLPSQSLKQSINSSKIISSLNSLLPPAPHVITDLGNLIDPNGFPDVFVGNEPIPRGNVSLPQLGSFQYAVNKDRLSVVRIQGIGCGGIVSGSGYVVASNLVATNAHVVAGISSPIVEDANGKHKSFVVLFDPNLDFAVLKTNGLAGGPLTLDTKNKSPTTQGVVLGYPGGGPFSASAAAIIEEFDASGRNIYGDGVTLRSVYELQANVIPGNSGGPLIEQNGEVMGTIFASSTTYNNIGYALAMQKVNSEINQAKINPQTSSNGQCAD